MQTTPTLSDRYRGALLGLACGDAVGTTVEFRSRGSFAPITDMVGGGPFQLQPGQWTDDTSMALCLAESLLTKNGFDAADQMGRYLNWWHWGYLSSTGTCFDIGMTVQQALRRFQVTGDPFAGDTNPNTAGNGVLMRLAPLVLFFYPDLDAVARMGVDHSRTTHGAPEAIECATLFGLTLAKALAGEPKSALLRLNDVAFSEPKVAALAAGSHATKPRDAIQGTGYAVASLEAALWCFHQTDGFEAAVLAATNLGDDADTTAAITGQLAGAHYGVQQIPPHWLARLHMRADIEATGDALLRAAIARQDHTAT